MTVAEKSISPKADLALTSPKFGGWRAQYAEVGAGEGGGVDFWSGSLGVHMSVCRGVCYTHATTAGEIYN